MALRDIMARDAEHLVRLEDLGEVLELRPKGSIALAYAVQGVVDRIGIIEDVEGDVAYKAVAVYLPPVGAAGGLTAAPVPGDVLVVAFDVGGVAEPGRVRSIVSHDAGGYLVEVSR